MPAIKTFMKLWVILYLIFTTGCRAGEAVPASASLDHTAQQRPCYLEEEEEEIYVSETMQEITDGTPCLQELNILNTIKPYDCH